LKKGSIAESLATCIPASVIPTKALETSASTLVNNILFLLFQCLCKLHILSAQADGIQQCYKSCQQPLLKGGLVGGSARIIFEEELDGDQSIK
jgi:hypothetical protein